MSTRLTKRTLRFELLQQRLLLTTNQADTAFDEVAVIEDTVLTQCAAAAADMSGPLSTGAGARNFNSTGESLLGQQQDAEDDFQRRFHLENGDEFIFDAPSAGRLVSQDGVVTAYRDVEIVRDGNNHWCTQEGTCWTTLMWGPHVCGKDRLGSYRDNIVDRGQGAISFDVMIIFGVPLEDPADVSGDGLVTPRDLLILFNDINTRGSRQIDGTGEDGDARLDVNRDGWFSPIDLLLAFNTLNWRQQSAADKPRWLESNEPPDQLYPITPIVSPKGPLCLPWGSRDLDLSTDAAGSVGTSSWFSPPGTDRSAAAPVTVQLPAGTPLARLGPRVSKPISGHDKSRSGDDFTARNIDEIFSHWAPERVRD